SCTAIVPHCKIVTDRAVWMSQMSKREPETATKLFIGPRVRRIRRQLGLSQTQMADELGVSPSYVNLIERNQRPVTAQILLKMAEAYDVDLRDLAAADKDRFFAELNEVFSDSLFRQMELPKQELRDLVELCPDAANAVQRLYRAYVEARRGVRTLPVDVMRDTLRRYVHHRRQLLLSELLDAAGCVFQVAFQLALAEARPQIDEIIRASGELDEPARRLFRISLANYFAAAVIM